MWSLPVSLQKWVFYACLRQFLMIQSLRNQNFEKKMSFHMGIIWQNWINLKKKQKLNLIFGALIYHKNQSFTKSNLIFINCRTSSFIWIQYQHNETIFSPSQSQLLYVDPFETPCRSGKSLQACKQFLVPS